MEMTSELEEEKEVTQINNYGKGEEGEEEEETLNKGTIMSVGEKNEVFASSKEVHLQNIAKLLEPSSNNFMLGKLGNTFSFYVNQLLINFFCFNY